MRKQETKSEVQWVVHLGLPRAGSTSLQMMLNQHGGDRFLGKLRERWSIDADWAHIFERELPYVSKHSATIERARLIADDIVNDLHPGVGRTLIISLEELSGAVHFAWRQSSDIISNIEKLNFVFRGRVKFVLVIRENFAWLFSIYKLMVALGLPITYSEFIWRCLWLDEKFILNCCNYQRIIDYCSAEEISIEMHMFEKILDDRKSLSQLAQSFGITARDIGLPHENKSLTGEMIEKYRLWNRSHLKDDALDLMWPEMYFKPGESRALQQFVDRKRGQANGVPIQSHYPDWHRIRFKWANSRVKEAELDRGIDSAAKENLKDIFRQYNRVLTEFFSRDDLHRFGYVYV